MDKVPMTVEGFRFLEDEVQRLKTVERPAIVQAIAEARSHGDLSENAEYHAAKEQQGHNEAKIADIEDKLSRADVIDVTTLSGKNVTFGATVKLVDEDTDEEVSYKIVGEFEADVKEGKVSITSPIARALIGKEVGESIEVITPKGTRAYEILGVKFK
ncbi:MAG: transcription elongation factor GreA [Methyloligellaceae bacterium]